MKRFKVCSVIFFCLLFCNVQAQAAPSRRGKDPLRSCGGPETELPFSIVGIKNYPPFSWIEVKGDENQDPKYKKQEYKGLILDLVKETANELQIVDMKNIVFDDFQQIQKAMLRGNAAFSFVTYYVDEAKSGQDYVYPAYFGNPFIVVSRNTKVIEVRDLSELKGLKGLIRREEIIEPLIRGSLPTDTKLEVVDGAETAFRKLLSGEVDFMLTSRYAADAESRRFKIQDKLHFGNTALRHIKYFVSFSKLSSCRVHKKTFEEKFKEKIKNKAAIEMLLQKHIMLWVEKFRDDPPLEYTPEKE